MKLFEAHIRLRDWGNWRAKFLNNGLGCPTQSTLVTALQGSRSTVPHYPPHNPLAEEIDGILCLLQETDRSIWDVANYEYTEAGTQKEKIRRLAIRKFEYQDRLKAALAWTLSALKFKEREYEKEKEKKQSLNGMLLKQQSAHPRGLLRLQG